MPFYKQPLLHFLMLGGLIFAGYQWLNASVSSTENQVIVVDNNSILEYIQYQKKAFNKAAATSYLKQLSNEERGLIVNRLIRDEVLFREAKKLNLDKKDEVIKRRLIQKMEYLTKGFDNAEEAITEDVVGQYFEQNKDLYYQLPILTFTHVFIDRSQHQAGTIQKISRKLGETLNNNKVIFSHASRYGDRFLYNNNYVERSSDYISAHFGKAFTDEVLQLKVREDYWYGPVESDHGLHLVMLVDHQAGGGHKLQSIYLRVYEDAKQAWWEQQQETVINEMIDSYKIQQL